MGVQVSSLVEHPLFLQDFGGGVDNGRRAAELVRRLRSLCAEPHYQAPPQGGFGQIEDPLVLAMLDVGLLVPRWMGVNGPCLVLPNAFTRTLLLAWTEAHCERL